MIRTAARKLPASNLLDTAAASLLLSFVFLLVLLSVVCEWTVLLVTEAHVCEQLAQGCYLKVERPGLEPATFCAASQHPNHYTTKPLNDVNEKLK